MKSLSRSIVADLAKQGKSKMSKILEGTSVLVQDDESTECAWCNEEQGIPQGNGSHGVCIKHARKLLKAHQERKARKERF